jgi:hypothetical protein
VAEPGGDDDGGGRPLGAGRRGTAAGGTAITATSIGPAMASSDLTVAMPSIAA